MVKQKITLFALALLVAMQSTLLLAQPNSLQQTAMSWPMQQGESLNDVARLFYPKDQYMQRQFVVATLKLNHETRPDLNATDVFTQVKNITIPDIKALSSKRQRQSVQKKIQSVPAVTTTQSGISAKLQADYDQLVQRNALFKQELEKLNAKLAQLEQVFASLKIELMQLINRSVPAAQPVTSAELQKTVTAPAIAPPVVKLMPTEQSSSHQSTILLSDKEKASSIYLWIPIFTTLLVMSLFIGFVLYARRQTGSVHLAADAHFAPLSKNAFLESISSVFNRAKVKTEPQILQSEFSGSIAEVDPSLSSTDEKEEGELVLEQAKIYVNLGRYDNAIQLLSAHIAAAPTSALQQWLYLLNIYRDTDQKEAFEESAQALHENFNVMMPQWEKVSTLDEFYAPAHTLEEYDYIVNKVTMLWADCEKEADKMLQTKRYLDKLLTDTRDHQRTGFSMDVFEEIVLLRDMLDSREKLAQEV